jgi:hypothetical protein
MLDNPMQTKVGGRRCATHKAEERLPPMLHKLITNIAVNMSDADNSGVGVVT